MGNEPLVEKIDVATQATEPQQVVPILAEELTVTKRKLDTGRVRINTVTCVHDELVDELLTRVRVEAERIPVGKLIDAVPPVREEGDTIIIPVVEEVLIVERRMVLKEEVRIRRVRSTERHQERVTLRQQEAVITRLPVETQPPNEDSVFPAQPTDHLKENR